MNKHIVKIVKIIDDEIFRIKKEIDTIKASKVDMSTTEQHKDVVLEAEKDSKQKILNDTLKKFNKLRKSVLLQCKKCEKENGLICNDV